MARRYEYYFQVVKTIFYEQAQREGKILFSPRKRKKRSRNKRTENIEISRKNLCVFHALHFFHIFTSENMENTSVLVKVLFSKTPITR